MNTMLTILLILTWVIRYSFKKMGATEKGALIVKQGIEAPLHVLGVEENF